MRAATTLSTVAIVLMPASILASELEVVLSGSVVSVDAPLTGEFSVGESVEIGAVLDTDKTTEMYGENATIDGTRFTARSAADVFFTIGADYSGGNTIIAPIFLDADGLAAGWDQGLDWGANNLQAPDVNGLSWAELYVRVGFTQNVLSGADDPLNLLTTADLLALDGIGLGGDGAQALIAFNSDGPGTNGNGYEYVEFDLTTISVTDLTEPSVPFMYVQQAGLADINGNNLPEIATLRVNRNGRPVVVIRDIVTADSIGTVPFLSVGYDPISLTVVDDVNGNGAEELVVLATRSTDGKVRTQVKDSLSGELIRSMSFAQ